MHRTPKWVLGFSRAEIQRGSLAFHLSTWNRTLDFYLGLYSLEQRKNSTYRTQVALAPLSTVHHFRTEFYCARCSESCFSGLESKLAFFMDAEVTFFQYAKTIPQSNVTFYCKFRLRFRSSWDILRLSITTFKGSYHGCSERSWCSKFAKVWEKRVWTSARSSTNFRAPSDSLFIICIIGHHPFKFQKKNLKVKSHLQTAAHKNQMS